MCVQYNKRKIGTRILGTYVHVSRFKVDQQAVSLPLTLDAELAEGASGSSFSRLASGERDKGALLSMHYVDGADLAKLVEVVPTEITG